MNYIECPTNHIAQKEAEDVLSVNCVSPKRSRVPKNAPREPVNAPIPSAIKSLNLKNPARTSLLNTVNKSVKTI